MARRDCEEKKKKRRNYFFLKKLYYYYYGYVVAAVYDGAEQKTYLMVFDGKHLSEGPVCTIDVKAQRYPTGFTGAGASTARPRRPLPNCKCEKKYFCMWRKRNIALKTQDIGLLKKNDFCTCVVNKFRFQNTK